MSNITRTGEGLGVVIRCSPTFFHDWLSFASWYSFQRNLPDAKIVLCISEGRRSRELFSWAYRAKIKIAKDYNFDTLHQINITPFIFAVREFIDLNIVSVKSLECATLVDCQDGCGLFDKTWETRLIVPFQITDQLGTENMTLNEMKVLQIWKDCYRSHVILN